MRYSRVLALLGVMAAIGVTAVLVAHTSRAATTHPQLRRALRQELRQFLATARHAAVPFRITAPSSQTCFVGAGSCSLTPCVVPVRVHSASALPAVPAVVTTAVTPSRRLLNSACPTGQATPRVLRVSGR